MLLILASLIFVWPGPVVRVLASANPDVIFYFATDRPLVGLTLDDGPHPETTAAILDLLAKHGATAYRETKSCSAVWWLKDMKSGITECARNRQSGSPLKSS